MICVVCESPSVNCTKFDKLNNKNMCIVIGYNNDKNILETFKWNNNNNINNLSQLHCNKCGWRIFSFRCSDDILSYKWNIENTEINAYIEYITPNKDSYKTTLIYAGLSPIKVWIHTYNHSEIFSICSRNSL
jgi:hypothetical protein